MTSPQIFTTGYGASLAYHKTPGRNPGVIFLTGFMSNMEGGKAIRLEQHLKARGNSFLRFDYRGHGLSSDLFENGCIGDWLADTLEAIDHLTEGPQLLVGSSMGGWIMLLSALQRKERIAGLVGIASAPDFTKTIAERYFTKEQRLQLKRDGRLEVRSEYDNQSHIITQRLLDEGDSHQLLNGSIDIDVPVRLIHGMEDEDVPWQTSLKLNELLRSECVETLLVKAGDHRLSSDKDLNRLCRVVDELLEQIENEESSE